MWLGDQCDQCKYNYLIQQNLMLHDQSADSLACDKSSHTKHSTLSGRGGGGGGSEARMTKLTADNQKPLTLWFRNLVTFSFYL